MIAAAALAVGRVGQRRKGRALSEIELRSRTRFEALVEGGSDLVVVTDLEGNVSYVSPAIVHILGYPQDYWNVHSPNEAVQTMLSLGPTR